VNTLVVAGFTLREARRRRLLLAGVGVSAAFVALYALGFTLLYHNAQGAPDFGPTDPILDEERLRLTVISGILVILGLYGVQFLGALLAVFLGVASISPDVDSGVLHAVLARPVSRLQYLLGRLLALALLLIGYVVVMGSAMLLIARTVSGYEVGSAVRTLGLMSLEVLVLLALSLLGSTVLPTLANGVVAMCLFGLAWLGGIIGYIGSIPPGNATLANLGTGVSLLLPSDAIWRAASYHVLSPGLLVSAQLSGAGNIELPFASTSPAPLSIVLWALAYPVVCLALAGVAFSRRNL
jgi:Cu-processing system permease protein